MSGWVWGSVVVLLVVVVLISLEISRSRTARLRRRFGPEYDRAVEAAGDRRDAEARLHARTRRRDQLDIVPLPEPGRIAYHERWRGVQEDFVDNPRHAVATAELLLHRVMAERGYPVADFERQSELISVDHPQLVEDYRMAHAIQQRHQDHGGGTDDLRAALLLYRRLFEGLLQPGQEPEPGDQIEPAGATVSGPSRDDGEEQP